MNKIPNNNSKIILEKRIISLFLIIFQSCGIRFFDGQGAFLMILVIALQWQNALYFKRKDLKIGLAIFFALIVIKLLNSGFEISKFIFFLGILLEVYLFLLTYRKNSTYVFEMDLVKVLNSFFIHAFFCFLFYTIFNGAFKENDLSGYPYQHLLHIFYLDREGRTTGLLWEPGVLQLLLNLLLFFSIKNNKGTPYIFLIILVIISTGSTTGYFILLLNFLFFLSQRINLTNPKVILTFVGTLILPILFYSVVKENLINKLGGENTSGLVRLRDLMVGYEMIKEKPILGHGLYELTYLNTKPYVFSVESGMFSEDYMQNTGDMGGGYTNGLLAIFTWFGIPLGVAIYILFYKNSLIQERRFFFFVIFALSLISEPLSYTPFFLLFPISFLVFRKVNVLD